MKNKPVYVEIPIEADMDKLWDATQSPDLHARWDLRFSSITYLPKKEESEPQHFEYKTNIGFGMSIEGFGKSAGEFHAGDGSRTSSLHFGTDQKRSLIREGRGYWKYTPDRDKVTFLTQYDYDVRFGRAGAILDRFLFRPMIGWATALSFDVLRRWLVKGETPESQYLRFFSVWVISFLFFFVWTYHGAVPKLFFQHPEEIGMAEKLLQIPYKEAARLTAGIGIAEILFGCLWLFPLKKKWLFGIQLLAFPMLALSAALADPGVLTHPFTPITFNAALFVLSGIGFFQSRDVPSAKSCRRKR